MNFPIETPETGAIDPEIFAVVDTLRKDAVTQKAPFLIHTAGIPGAGKSSFAHALPQALAPEPLTLLAFDNIMESIPSYRAMNDKENAFAQFELPARAAGYWLVRELITKKANILFDHSASFPKHVELLRFAKNTGYTIAFAPIHVSPERAKKRILGRQSQEGRYTPLSYVDERAIIIESLLDRYKALADIITVVDNDHDDKNLSFFDNAAKELAEKIQTFLSRGIR